MGLIGGGIKITLVALLAVFLAPGLPPHYEFTTFSLGPQLELKGPLANTGILDKAEEVKLDKPIQGPESVAIRGDEIFSGLHDGSLVKIKDGKVTKIISLGEPVEAGYSGRIAGLRFDSKGKLLAADAVNGIFRIDVDTGKAEHLVKMTVPIDGVPPSFPDDLDIDKSGNIYWSDATTISDIYSLPLEALAGPSGRLVRYNAKTGDNTVLMTKLHFPNGIQLSADEEFVLVSETMRARVWRYYIKGPKQGQSDIFVDKLPGFPDNIRPNGRGGFYIVLARPMDSELSPLEHIGEWPLTRRFVVRLHHYLVQGLAQIHNIFPNVVLKEWILWIKGFGVLGDLERNTFKSIIVETDGSGKIIGNLQSKTGDVVNLSEMSVGKVWAYFGTPSTRKLYRMKTSDIPVPK